MKINDVEKITGLTAKAIRLYESKGLINVSRGENGYRNYTESDLEALKKIKLFRSVGISISDIKLYLFGVMSIEELMDKRKDEILKESGRNSEKYSICEKITGEGSFDVVEGLNQFNETEKAEGGEYGNVSVGIDIGTTTISAVVYDIDGKEQIEAYTLPHHSYTVTGDFSEQSVSLIMEKSKKLLNHIIDTYENIVTIGISGQMHGIVYLDKNGQAVSELINWQDKRGDMALDNGMSACQSIFHITGEKIATGYGIATHYYNMQRGMVPRDATVICTVMDYFAMDICGNSEPITHASLGASLGLFDTKNGCFMKDKLSLIGIDVSLLPRVTEKSIVIGNYRSIPVSVPIGDNQASFLGAVSHNRESMLVNMGTGSQVSMVTDYTEATGDIEIRPFIEGEYLICGSALCGGFAYSMIEEFFRSYTVSLGIKEDSQYKIINQLALSAYENKENGLDVDACFCGKRSDPNIRGSINNIDRHSFTPANLVLGVLKGMCKELYELYKELPSGRTHIVASGGAVKKNRLMKDLIRDCFNMEVSVSFVKEEAATGAALFSALAAGKISYQNGFSDYIKYE